MSQAKKHFYRLLNFLFARWRFVAARTQGCSIEQLGCRGAQPADRARAKDQTLELIQKQRFDITIPFLLTSDLQSLTSVQP
jgi:hypothetical protein